MLFFFLKIRMMNKYGECYGRQRFDYSLGQLCAYVKGNVIIAW